MAKGPASAAARGPDGGDARRPQRAGRGRARGHPRRPRRHGGSRPGALPRSGRSRRPRRTAGAGGHPGAAGSRPGVGRRAAAAALGGARRPRPARRPARRRGDRLPVRCAPPTSITREVAFSVRSEEVGAAAAGVLGALTQIGGGAASDAGILHDYIRSQEIVEAVDARLDLRAIWNRPGSGWRDGDPVFALGGDPVDRGAAPALAAHGHRHPTTPDTGLIDVDGARLHARGRARDRRGGARSSRAGWSTPSPSRRARTRCASPARSSPRPRRHLAAMRAELAGFRRAHNLVDPTGRRRRAERAPQRRSRRRARRGDGRARRAGRLRPRRRPAPGPGRPPDRGDHRAHRGRARRARR